MVTKSSILIRGGGLAGWSAAAALAQELNGLANIYISPGDGMTEPLAYGSAVVDTESVYMQYGGQTAAELLQNGGGGFSLGSCYRNWGPGGRDVFHAPGEPLPNSGSFDIHHILLRAAMAEGKPEHFAARLLPLNFQARLAGSGRFAPPAEDRQSPRSLLNPAIAMDGRVLAEAMEAAALANGVTEAPDDLPVVLLTLDCRPADRAGEWQDMTADFGYDRCCTAYATLSNGSNHVHQPYSEIRALDVGLLCIMPLRGGCMAQLCYLSADRDATRAQAELAAALPGYELTDTADRAAAPGYLARPWHDRTVRIGIAAARLGPALNADVTLLSMQIKRLVALLPPAGASGDDIAVRADEYNRLAMQDLGHMYDFLRAPLVRNALAGRHWQELRQRPVSDRLRRRLAAFERRGHPVLFDGDLFAKHVWVHLLTGLGIVPAQYDRVADGSNLAARLNQLRQTQQAFDQTIRAMPKHGDFLKETLERL